MAARRWMKKMSTLPGGPGIGAARIITYKEYTLEILERGKYL